MLGKRLSHYRLKEKLGAGGMGEVYRAEDTKLKREVALKVLPAEFATDSERLRRFRREAQTVAALDHPGIITIFSVEEADGIHFLTMQLVEGKTLESLIPVGGIDSDRFFDIAIQLSDAVGAAHERGIIHRDLKPSNVMVTGPGRVKVLDFGLAKLTEPSNNLSTAFQSKEGMVVGTLPYMSPEQISGQVVDHRSDIFSMGILFFEMATGTHPFSGKTPAARLLALFQENPPEITKLRPDLPPHIGAVITNCLKREVAERIQTARELHMRLRTCNQEVATAVISQPREAPVPARTLASVGVLPFTSLSQDPEDEFFADGISEEIINALGRLPDLKVAARTSSFSFKGKNEDLRVIADKLGVTSVLEGSVRRAGKRLRITAQLVDANSGYHLWSERYDREYEDIFDVQDEIAQNIAYRLTSTIRSDPDPALLHHGTKDVDAFRIYTQGRGLLEHRTQDGLWRAVTCFNRALERDSAYAPAWAGLGSALALLEDYGYAERESLLLKAREATLRALEINPELAEAHVAFALLHGSRREFPGYIKGLERAIEIRPNHADAYSLLSWVHTILGNIDQALEYGKRSVDLNPLFPEAISHLILVHMAKKEFDLALREIYRVKEFQPHFDTLAFYEGIVLYELKDFERARAILHNLDVPWTGKGPLATSGFVELSTGNKERAREIAAQLVRENEKACAAMIHSALGETETAFDLLESVERFDYWPSIAILNLFHDELDPIRKDSRYPNLVRKVRSSWGMENETL